MVKPKFVRFHFFFLISTPRQNCISFVSKIQGLAHIRSFKHTCAQAHGTKSKFQSGQAEISTKGTWRQKLTSAFDMLQTIKHHMKYFKYTSTEKWIYIYKYIIYPYSLLPLFKPEYCAHYPQTMGTEAP